MFIIKEEEKQDRITMYLSQKQTDDLKGEAVNKTIEINKIQTPKLA